MFSAIIDDPVGVPVMLSNQLYGCALLIAMGGFKALYAAWLVRVTEHISTIRATQQFRHNVLLIGAFISFVPMMLLLHKYGVADFRQAMREWQNIDVDLPIGECLTVCFYFGLATPIWAPLCALRIYFRPAMAGRRVRGGYKLTSDMRSGRKSCPVYTRNQVRFLELGALQEGWYLMRRRQQRQRGLALEYHDACIHAEAA